MNLNTHPQRTYQDLVNGNKLAIGWGTGSVFERFYPLLPVSAQFLVDNNPQNFGKKGDLNVKSPDTLLNLDPSKVVIVIYSSFVEQISEQIRAMGPFEVVTAGALIGHEEIDCALCAIESKLHSAPSGHTPAGDCGRAIVITGPVIHDQHVKIIESYRAYNPKDKILLSTYEASHPALIEQLQDKVDFCLLNTPPQFAGFQERNYHILLTANAIRKAQQLWKPTKIFKTQTDVALLATDLLDSCDDALGLYDAPVAQKHGLKNRILISDIFTRKYVPYHASTLVMYGHTEDLYKYWSQPFDNRNIQFENSQWSGKPIRELSQQGELSECFFARGFANNIQRTLTNDLEDSWSFYRDFFLIKDASWFNLFWLKHPRPTVTDYRNEVARCASSRFWQRLYFNRVHLKQIKNEKSWVNLNWDAFTAPLRNTQAA